MQTCVLCPDHGQRKQGLFALGRPPKDCSLEELGGESRPAHVSFSRESQGPLLRNEANLEKNLICSLPPTHGEGVGGTTHVRKSQLDSKPQHRMDWGWFPCGLRPATPPQGGGPCGSQGTQRLSGGVGMSGGVGRASAGGYRPTALSTGACVPRSASSQEGACLPPARVTMMNGGQLTPGPRVRHPRVPTARQHLSSPQVGTWSL